MKFLDAVLLISLAAIWGSSFIFMRASVEAFGPVALIAVRIIIAAICMSLFLFNKKRIQEFKQHWLVLLIVGLASSSISFILLAYASLTLTGGTVSILNAMTPIFTALIAHFALNIRMNSIQFMGMFISVFGLVFLVWDKVNWSLNSWLPALAGVAAALCYGVANNLSKKYLSNVSIFTSSSGSLVFSAIFMGILLPFFMPDIEQISSVNWLYAIVLGVVCTALAYVIHFRLIKSIAQPVRLPLLF